MVHVGIGVHLVRGPTLSLVSPSDLTSLSRVHLSDVRRHSQFAPSPGVTASEGRKGQL